MALIVVSHYGLVEYSGELYIAQSLIMMHLFFNGILLLFLPFLGIFKPATELFLPADSISPFRKVTQGGLSLFWMKVP